MLVSKKEGMTMEEEMIMEAIDTHIEALDFEKHVMISAMVLYFVGLPLWVIGSGWVEAIGIALAVVGLIALLIHHFASRSTEKKRVAASELIKPYLKKKTAPLFQELQEKLSDNPNIQLKHGDGGKIIVIDKREEERWRKLN